MITEIPEGHAVVRFTYDTKDAEASLKRLTGNEQALAAARQAGLTNYNAQLAKMGERLGEVGKITEATANKWKASTDGYLSGTSLLDQAMGAFSKKVQGLGADFGKMAFSFAAGSVVFAGLSAALDGLGEMLVDVFVDKLPTDEDVKTLEKMAHSSAFFGEAAREALPKVKALLEQMTESKRAMDVLRDAQQDLLGYFNKGADAAEVYSDKFLLLNKWMREGTIDAAQFRDGLHEITEEFDRNSGAAKRATDAWNDGFRNLQRIVASDMDLLRDRKRLAEQARSEAEQLDDLLWAGRDAENRRSDKLTAQRLNMEAGGRQNALERDMNRSGVAFEGGRWSGERGYDPAGDSVNFGASGPQESPLVAALGPIEQFDAYREAFGALSGAATTAYEAFVTGSTGAGAAIKAFSADLALSIGKRSVLRAAEEVALAIAEPWAAAQHLTAAAKFAGVAVLAGVVASQLGGGGGSGGGAGAAPYSPSSSGTGGGAEIHNHYYADTYANKSPRDRQRRAEDEMRDRNGGGAGFTS